MSNFITNDWLNLRSSAVIPEERGSNVIGVLPPGTVVEKLPGESTGKWLHVKTFLGNHLVEGFTSSLFLDETTSALPGAEPVAKGIPAVHLPLKAGKIVQRTETNGRAYPLNEPGIKQFDITQTPGAADNIQQIHDILNWIDVEHSARYAPTSASTYCNIYAYDVAYCCGLYIPRVWWNEAALKKIDAGTTPDVIYETTVTELNANALTNWFENYGSIFGWQRILDVETLQNKVNTGSLGIIVAQRINLNRSGHIIAVVPETTTNKAQRDAGNKIISPLQSQAGVSNKKYFTGNNWWANPNKFRKFGMWVWGS